MLVYCDCVSPYTHDANGDNILEQDDEVDWCVYLFG